MEARDPPQERHILTSDPEVPTTHPAVAEQRRKNRNDGADRHREAEPLSSRDDGRVHPDDRSVARHQWSA